ncbi:MAG: UDP-N-acetylglucosamine--N-acetylmuramyl-(pentapeptide) pyrophosphoryl-undecaprenol N-acetylglucosamine transferase [Patescibacteria group bacterium]
MTKPLKIMLSGGGSGGPVTPLLAVARELYAVRPEVTFTFIGGHVGPEKSLVAEAAITLPIIFIPILSGKFRRYFSWHNFTDLFNIGGAFFQSLYLLKKDKPDVVISAGAFTSVPLVWAAKLINIPVLIHQQDVRPGLANRLMAGAAKIVTVTFEESLKIYGAKAVLTGNPVIFPKLMSRDEVFKNYNLDVKRPLVLIFGGGTGSEAINEAVNKNLDKLLDLTQVIHVSGRGKTISSSKTGYYVTEFLNHEQLVSAMSVSDIIVARAGLATITELSALKKPSILIPIPHSQQEDNAKVCLDKGAALILNQSELNNKLTFEIRGLFASEVKRRDLAEAMARINKSGAAVRIVELVLSLVK